MTCQRAEIRDLDSGQHFSGNFPFKWHYFLPCAIVLQHKMFLWYPAGMGLFRFYSPLVCLLSNFATLLCSHCSMWWWLSLLTSDAFLCWMNNFYCVCFHWQLEKPHADVYSRVLFYQISCRSMPTLVDAVLCLVCSLSSAIIHPRIILGMRRGVNTFIQYRFTDLFGLAFSETRTAKYPVRFQTAFNLIWTDAFNRCLFLMRWKYLYIK